MCLGRALVLANFLSVSIMAAVHSGPQDAPITLIEFADYQCTFCAKTAPVLRQLQQQYPGKIHFIFKYFRQSPSPETILAQVAAMAASEQGKFWEMQELLYANSRNLASEQLLTYAGQAHLELRDFEKIVGSGASRTQVEQDLAEARALGVNATPTLFLNGRKLVGQQSLETLQRIVDQELNVVTTAEPAFEQLETGGWTIDLRHAPARGPDHPLVSIVEFSDFQCPFCKSGAGALTEIGKLYPDKVRIAFKHFPLNFHAQAMLAHQASLAAGKQGKFWEMHDWLFEHQNKVQSASLLEAAAKLDLNVEQFRKDLESGTFKTEVEADRAEGMQLGIDGTPTMFINGRKVTGAASVESLKRWVDQALILDPSQSRTAGAANPALTSGAADAPVEIVWFSDLASPLSARASELMRDLVARNAGKVRVVFRNFPQPGLHPDSSLAHRSALAASRQGKFREMASCLVVQLPVTESRVSDCAESAHLNQAGFAAALGDAALNVEIERDLADAERLRVHGSPVFFMNGKRIDGLQQAEVFQTFIDSEISEIHKLSLAQ